VKNLDSSGDIEKELLKIGIPRGSFVIEKAEPVINATTLQNGSGLFKEVFK